MIVKKSFSLILFTLLLMCKVFPQPMLRGLQVNPVLQNQTKAKTIQKPSSLKSAKTSVEKPLFIDDFSNPSVYPDQANWEDSSVFINNTFCNNPITIGVATFDALDQNGEVYTRNNTPPEPFRADSLTSKPINLSGKNQVYLSFFYQPKGLGGAAPEIQDTFLLEISSLKKPSWVTAWRAMYDPQADTVLEKYLLENRYFSWKPKISPADTFKFVILQINDASFLTDSFRFRFRNYASISSSPSDSGKKSNCDYWNLDYVYLNSNRNPNDTIMHEVSMLSTSGSQLNNFEAVPWKHFMYNRNLLKSKVGMTYRNLDNVERNVNRKFRIKELYHNLIDSISDFGNIDIPKNYIENYYEAFVSSYFPFDNSSDSACFLIYDYLDQTGNEMIKSNDTARYYQVFKDYYAYDDGIPELGFGISGRGSSGASCALQFANQKPDTLQGLYFYFNASYKKFNQNLYFELAVWNDDNGKPGSLLFDTTGYQIDPNYLNKYRYYKIHPIYIPQDEVFYIGWKQVNEEFLNLGFDVNRDSRVHTFYNFTGSWEQSTFKGSLMIRPSFGRNKSIHSGLNDLNLNQNGVKIYPNPANDYIQLQLSDNLASEKITYSIISLTGQILSCGSYTFENITVTDLPAGMYLLQLKSRNINQVYKFLITH
jgi:hypothetical protein